MSQDLIIGSTSLDWSRNSDSSGEKDWRKGFKDPSEKESLKHIKNWLDAKKSGNNLEAGKEETWFWGNYWSTSTKRGTSPESRRFIFIHPKLHPIVVNCQDSSLNNCEIKVLRNAAPVDWITAQSLQTAALDSKQISRKNFNLITLATLQDPEANQESKTAAAEKMLSFLTSRGVTIVDGEDAPAPLPNPPPRKLYRSLDDDVAKPSPKKQPSHKLFESLDGVSFVSDETRAEGENTTSCGAFVGHHRRHHRHHRGQGQPGQYPGQYQSQYPGQYQGPYQGQPDPQKLQLLRSTYQQIKNGHVNWLTNQDHQNNIWTTPANTYLQASKLWARQQLQQQQLPIRSDPSTQGQWQQPLSWFQAQTQAALNSAAGQIASSITTQQPAAVLPLPIPIPFAASAVPAAPASPMNVYYPAPGDGTSDDSGKGSFVADEIRAEKRELSHKLREWPAPQ